MKRGQSSIELGIILAMLLVVFLALLNISLGRESQLNYYRDRFAASALTDDIAAAVNRAHLRGNGAEETLILPATLGARTPYAVSITARQVSVTYGEHRSLALTLAGNMTQVDPPPGATLHIRNVNGVIVIA